MSKVLGIKIDEYSFSQVMRKITEFLQSNKMHQIATVNPEFIVAAQKDKEFKDILNKTDLNIPDGFGLKIAGLIKRQKIGERTTGVDLTWEIAKLSAERGYAIYLLGGKPGVAKMTAQRMKMLYRHIKIVEADSANPDNPDVIDRINKSKADILLVAYGAPKQEKFINQYRNKLNCKVAMGVGGTFDYISGNIPRAPKWLRSLGLEWLYRLFKQPSRIRRIYTAVIKFPLMVVFSR